MKAFSPFKSYVVALVLALTSSLGFALDVPSPAPPPKRPPGAPPAVKSVVRVTKAPALGLYSDNSPRSLVIMTLPQGTLLDVFEIKGNWYRVGRKGAGRPGGWVPKNHVIRVR